MLTLKAEKREIFGKRLEAARQDGKLPVVVYGRKDEATSLFVDVREFKKVLNEAGESTLISLDDKDVLIKDVAYHPVSGEPVHADFYAVEKGKPVQVNVELEFEGEAPAIKQGGNLVKALHEIEIEALPKDLPNGLTVDVSVLATNDAQILAKDIKLPAGVTLITDPEEVVALISAGGEDVTEEGPVDLSSIEVEERGKKEEAEEAAE